jgi:hypothetical protein
LDAPITGSRVSATSKVFKDGDFNSAPWAQKSFVSRNRANDDRPAVQLDGFTDGRLAGQHQGRDLEWFNFGFHGLAFHQADN